MGDRPRRDTQAFFAPRAATWDERFPDDGPAYAAAVAALAPPAGATVLDVGAGTGRAIPPLRAAVGAGGRVVALDATAEMLAAAHAAGRAEQGALVHGDALALPFGAGVFSAVLAAGIVSHLPGPDHGLDELARVTMAGGRLAVFHPIGRAALAARHGHAGAPSLDDVLAPANLTPLLARHGWHLDSMDDGPDRYLALATRR